MVNVPVVSSFCANAIALDTVRAEMRKNLAVCTGVYPCIQNDNTAACITVNGELAAGTAIQLYRNWSDRVSQVPAIANHASFADCGDIGHQWLLFMATSPQFANLVNILGNVWHRCNPVNALRPDTDLPSVPLYIKVE